VTYYTENKLSIGIPIYMVSEKLGIEFDWSTHFIEPLISQSRDVWMKRYESSDKQRIMFPNVNDWILLYNQNTGFIFGVNNNVQLQYYKIDLTSHTTTELTHSLTTKITED